MATATLSRDLHTVTDTAVIQAEPLWTLPPDALTVAIPDVVPSLIAGWSDVGGALAADHYDDERERNAVKGSFRAFVAPLDDPGRDAALVNWILDSLTVIVSSDDAEREGETVQAVETAKARLAGGVQLRVADAANLTMTSSAHADPQARGWRRTPSSGACDFCRMVADRGGVFTKATSRFACHDHCHCTAGPSWDSGHRKRVDPYTPSSTPMTAVQRAQVRRWLKRNADNLK